MCDIHCETLQLLSPWLPQGQSSLIAKVVVGMGAKMKAAICSDGADSTEKK